MIICKFGGSSVGDAKRIRTVFDIVKGYLSKKPIVVVSAHKGVTDELIKVAESALDGKSGLDGIRHRHATILSELGLPTNLIDDRFAELDTLLRGITMVKELTPRTLDYVLSFGERLSSRIIAAYFNKAGIPAEQYDAFDIGMLTDDNFGGATPLPEADALIKQSIEKIKKLPIVTGYIGKTRSGDVTTLGRNGSDYTASIIGAAINADEIQIWTDVDGVMTADPSIIPDAKPLDTMTFEEASELAYYGAEVLHPATIVPAIKKGIPVRVLNTFRPDAKGTIITDGKRISPSAKRNGTVKSIVYKEDQYIVNITTSRMLMGYGFLAKIFNIFAIHKIVVNMVATSEVSVSVTVEKLDGLDIASKELSTFSDVSVEKEKAIICVVGEGLRDTSGVAGDIFSALKAANVNILMISQGASKINCAFVIENRDIKKCVEALHNKFFK